MLDYREWCKTARRPYPDYFEEYERGFFAGKALAELENSRSHTATDAQFAARVTSERSDQVLPLDWKWLSEVADNYIQVLEKYWGIPDRFNEGNNPVTNKARDEYVRLKEFIRGKTL